MKSKKQKPVVKAKISERRRTTAERDVRVFHRLTNWAQWWEEWFTSIQADGKYLYTTIRGFAKTKTKIKAQEQFIRWYLGPKPEEKPEENTESPYPWCVSGPLDWMEKRKSGGWFTDSSIRDFGKEIRRRMTALEALREAGNGVTLNSLVRAEQLAQELDRSFKGRMFLDSLSWDANLVRARAYINLHNDILGMKARAQDLYAKSHGVNFDDMSGLTVLLQAAAIGGATSGDEDKRGKAALSSVVDMMLRKSQKYDMELPPGAVEVLSEAVEKEHAKKKNVQ